MEPDEIDPNGDAELAEDSAEVTNGASADADVDVDAAARRAERRRQQRAKRKHGRP
jgi:hypothetical protein